MISIHMLLNFCVIGNLYEPYTDFILRYQIFEKIDKKRKFTELLRKCMVQKWLSREVALPDTRFFPKAKTFNIFEVHNYFRQKPDMHLKRNSLDAYRVLCNKGICYSGWDGTSSL